MAIAELIKDLKPAISILKIARLVSGVIVDANGNPAYPIDKTLAEFLALTPGQLADGAVVHITDLHGTSGAGGVYATWDATASEWGQNFGTPWVFDTFPLLLASFPLVSKWDGFKFWVNNGVGYNGAELIHKTTRYKHTQKGRVLMAINNTRDTVSTNKSVEKIECQWAIPAAFLAAADKISVDSHASKSGTTAANFLARDFHLGSAGTAADASMMNIGSDLRATSSNTNIGVDEQKQWVITSATTIQRAGPQGSLDNGGFSTTTRDSAQTIPNISGALYFSAGYWISNAAPTDTLTFESCAIYLEMGS